MKYVSDSGAAELTIDELEGLVTLAVLIGLVVVTLEGWDAMYAAVPPTATTAAAPTAKPRNLRRLIFFLSDTSDKNNTEI